MSTGQTLYASLPARRNQWKECIGWVPLALLPMMAMMLRTKLLPWAFMWLLALAIFAGCKWQTWWQARAAGDAGNWKRSAAYFLLWPGMEAREFFAVAGETRSTPASAWLSGVAKTLAGIVLTWAGAQVVALRHPLVGGWTGMAGLVVSALWDFSSDCPGVAARWTSHKAHHAAAACVALAQ